MTAFVLLERLATKKNRKPILFEQMTGIGPKTTADIESAKTFESEAAAPQCPAYFHTWSFYTVVPVDQVDTFAADLIDQGDAKGGGA